MDSPIEGLTLPCPNHGEVDWVGDVFCKNCNAIYLCTGIEESDEFNDRGEKKKKFVYPESPPKGVCTCGKRLFGGTDFTARPMCHECALTVSRRKAAQEGKIFWEKDPDGGMDEEDYADPFGDRSFTLTVFAGVLQTNKDKFMWELYFPDGHCQGECDTREQARKVVESIFRTLTITLKET